MLQSMKQLQRKNCQRWFMTTMHQGQRISGLWKRIEMHSLGFCNLLISGNHELYVSLFCPIETFHHNPSWTFFLITEDAHQDSRVMILQLCFLQLFLTYFSFWGSVLIIYLVHIKQIPATYSCWCKQDRLDCNYIGLQSFNANHDCSDSHAEDGSPWRYVIRLIGVLHEDIAIAFIFGLQLEWASFYKLSMQKQLFLYFQTELKATLR